MRAKAAQVVWLASAGSEGFVAEPEWRGGLTRQGIRCGHCQGVRPDCVTRLDRVIISRDVPRCAVGLVSALWGGCILRDSVAERIGVETLRRLCHTTTVYDSTGLQLPSLTHYHEATPRGLWRGSSQSKIGLCRECGRVLYWPVPTRYLLRQYWDGAGGATILGGDILATPAFADSLVQSGKFKPLLAERYELRDEPEDGLPADYLDLVAELHRRGWTR